MKNIKMKNKCERIIRNRGDLEFAYKTLMDKLDALEAKDSITNNDLHDIRGNDCVRFSNVIHAIDRDCRLRMNPDLILNDDVTII